MRWPAPALALCALIALPARAGVPVILVEGKVPQYREAAAAARKQLDSATEVDPGDAGAAAKLADASLVVAVGHKAFAVARSKAVGTPVVFCMVLGASHGTLSTTVTGVPLESDPQVVLSQIKAIAGAKRVGVVYNPQASEVLLEEAQRVAAGVGVTLVGKPVGAASDVTEAVKAMASSIDALWLPPDPKLFSKELFGFLLSFSAERKLPLFGFLDSFTQAGALASISPDYADIGDRAGRLAAEILARPEGRRIPVPGPVFAPGNLTINSKTAQALGITISPKALAAAKQVF